MAADFNSLTLKQKKVYSAIESFIKQNTIPPTVREIGEMLGEKTPGSVQGILNRLEEKGVIKREVGMARSIKLVSNDSQYIDPVYVPEIKKITKRNVDNLLNIYNINKYHPVTPHLVESADNCYMIKCPDSGITNSCISNDDMLIMRSDCEINQEDMVLALYDNLVILRKYSESGENGKVHLKPGNPVVSKETFDLEEVRILGKVVARYSKYQ